LIAGIIELGCIVGIEVVVFVARARYP